MVRIMMNRRLHDLDSVALRALASRKDTPKPILLALAGSENILIREAVAENTNAGSEILSLLALDVNEDVRRRVASNSSTSGDVLRLLAEDSATWYLGNYSREWIKKAVAGNSNTPPEILDAFVRFESRGKALFVLCGDDVATEAAKNPRMPIEGLLRDLNNDAAWAYEYIACNQRASEDMLRKISSLEEGDLKQFNTGEGSLRPVIGRIMDNLAANPSTPIDVLENERLNRSIVAANPSTPVEMLESIFYRDAADSDKVQKALAANPNTPPDILHSISNSIFSDAANRVAANPSTAKEDLVRLAQERDLSPWDYYSRTERKQYLQNRINVASNPNTPIEVLHSLFSKGYERSIAANPSATPEMLAVLASNEDENVRLAAYTNERFNLLSELRIDPGNISDYLQGIFPAKNNQDDEALFSEELQFIELMSALALRGDTPDDYFDYIIEKGDSPMRTLMAKNKSLTQQHISRLSRDVSYKVRREIASRSDLHLDVLNALVNDRDRSVSEAAMCNAIGDSTIKHVCHLDALKSSKLVAENANADPAELKAISQTSKDNQILSALAKNPSTPIDVLTRFAAEGKFIRSLAANPSLTEDLADYITQIMDGNEKRILLSNRSTPSRTLEACSNPQSDDGWGWQRAIASNPNATPGLLDEFACSDAAVLRALVAANPNTAQKTLLDLSGDADPMVRWCVARNPNINPDILSKLLTDEEKGVRSEAIDNPSSSRIINRESLLDEEALPRRLQDASSSQTEAKRIIELANDDNPVVRIAARSNLKYPLSSILEKLQLICRENLYLDDQCHSNNCDQSRNHEKNELDLNDVNNRLSLAERKDIPKWLQCELAEDTEPCVRRALAGNMNADPSVLETIYRGDSGSDVLTALTSNPSTPDFIMEELALMEEPEIASSLSNNPNVTPRILSSLIQGRKSLDFVGYDLARDPNTKPELLDTMARSGHCSFFSLEKVAANPSTPAETLAILSKKGPSIRASVAKNPSTPNELLFELSDDESCEVRCGVAKNPHLSENLCVKLFTESASLPIISKNAIRWIVDNGTSYARYLVASGYGAPEECLIQLANDEDPEIKKAVYENRRTPEVFKEKLFNEGAANCSKTEFQLRKAHEQKENQYLRVENEPYYYLVSNPNTPGIILGFMLKKSNRLINGHILSHPNTPHSALLEYIEEYGSSSSIATRSDISDELLRSWSKDERKDVRAAVATNANTPERALIALVKDPDKDVAERALRNSSLSTAYVAKFAQSQDYWIREAVIDNPNMTSEILNKLAGDRDELIRIKVAECKKTSAETLTRLSKDQSDNVRSAVACNQNTPSRVLASLSQDCDSKVRFRALRNPKLCLLDHFEIRPRK